MPLRDQIESILFEAKGSERRTASSTLPKTGTAIKKAEAKDKAGDRKGRDAARKRVERAAGGRDQETKDDLVKQMMAVKTRDGHLQIIYKDSFDENFHTPYNTGRDLSIAEAKNVSETGGFQQTKASKDLLGAINGKDDVDKKEKKEKKSGEDKNAKKTPAKDKGKDSKGAKARDGDEKKPRRLSEEEIFQALATMQPQELEGVPFDVRQNYFMATRLPVKASEFDSLAFKDVAARLGIDATSDEPMNTQTRNALIVMGRMKAGASEQELGFLTTMRNGSLGRFSEAAFDQARKMLSQIGDTCLQSMVSTLESGMDTPTIAAGNVDFSCGNFRFGVNTQGEVSVSTDALSQEGKGMKQVVGTMINAMFADPAFIESDRSAQKSFLEIQTAQGQFAPMMFSNASFETVKRNPKALEKMKELPVVLQDGQEVGPLVDPNGQLNPVASYDNFLSYIQEVGKGYMRANKTAKGQFLTKLKQLVTTSWVRGDGIKPPELSPTHVVTGNGVFPLNDDYLDNISRKTDMVVKDGGELFSGTSTDYDAQTADSKFDIARFRTVVEDATSPLEASPEELFAALGVQTGSLNPAQLLADSLSRFMQFDVNISLLPGTRPRNNDSIDYNYLHQDGKVTSIPVDRDSAMLTKVYENLDAVIGHMVQAKEDRALAALHESGILDIRELEMLLVESGLEETVKAVCLARIDRDPHLVLDFVDAFEARG